MEMRKIITDYVKDLLKDTVESYKKMTPDEKEMFVKDTLECLDEDVKKLANELNLELCVKKYGNMGDYEYFMLNKNIYCYYSKPIFEDIYRKMINKMIEDE